MQLHQLTTILALAIMPTALAAPPSSPGADLAARKFYDGPCEHTNCGVEGVDCRATKRAWCVRYPSIDKPEGCTCSHIPSFFQKIHGNLRYCPDGASTHPFSVVPSGFS
ncbi:hypothetical protein F4779DRAFT_618849 [Xylariaceae sp. FL0662B]|nr:hypothetical protein F4779DRAFT_618849 [Xylariaceae sp. FL0662B]